MCRANFTLFSCEFLRFFTGMIRIASQMHWQTIDMDGYGAYGWAYMTCVQTQPFLDGETVLLLH